MTTRRTTPHLASLAALACLALAACKPSDPAKDTSPESSATSAAPPGKSGEAAATAPPKRKPITAKSIQATRCNLPAVPQAAWVKEKQNQVAAARHLHLASDGSLYFFPDFLTPVRLAPTTDGCGYRFVGPLPEKKDFDYGLEPGGTIGDYKLADESKKTTCRLKALREIRYGSGRVSGSKFLWVDHGDLTSVDLADDACEPKPVTLPELPKNLTGVQNVRSGAGELLVQVPRSDWGYSAELFRFDAGGKLLERVGSPTTKLSQSAVPCGDGYCDVGGWPELVVHDHTGAKVTSVQLGEVVKGLESPMIQGVVEVADKGVYVLVGELPKGGTGRAELVRLTGID